MNPSEIKRQILANSHRSGFREQLKKQGGLSNDEIVAMGSALESMVKTSGWTYTEAYIIRNTNLVGRLFDDEDLVAKGETRALVKIMQWIDQIITAKNEIVKGDKQPENPDSQ